jgi:hypothetical protein
MLVYGIEESHTLTEELKEVFFRLIYAMDYDPKATQTLRQIQEYVSFQNECQDSRIKFLEA